MSVVDKSIDGSVTVVSFDTGESNPVLKKISAQVAISSKHISGEEMLSQLANEIYMKTRGLEFLGERKKTPISLLWNSFVKDDMF